MFIQRTGGRERESRDRDRNKEREYQYAVISHHQELITKTRDQI